MNKTKGFVESYAERSYAKFIPSPSTLTCPR